MSQRDSKIGDTDFSNLELVYKTDPLDNQTDITRQHWYDVKHKY